MTFDLSQAQAVIVLAWRHLSCGRHQEASILFELLLKLMPASSELRLALASAQLGCGRPADAAATLSVLESSHDPVAHFLRGRALARLGHMDDARLAFNKYRECRKALP